MSTEEIVYGESVRAIESQVRAVDGLRVRAGTLFSAAAVATAFLGGQALARDTSVRVVAWTAIGAYLVVGALCVLILLDRDWRIALSARVLLEDFVDVEERNTPARLHRFLATTLEANWDRNQRKVSRLYWYFRLAAGCLAAEVIMWSIDLGIS